MGLRPTRFTGFTATLILTGCVGSCSFGVEGKGYFLTLLTFVVLPVVLVVLRGRAKSTLMCLTFFLMLCHRNVPKIMLFSNIYTMICFIINVHFSRMFVTSAPAPVKRFSILSVILLFTNNVI